MWKPLGQCQTRGGCWPGGTVPSVKAWEVVLCSPNGQHRGALHPHTTRTICAFHQKVLSRTNTSELLGAGNVPRGGHGGQLSTHTGFSLHSSQTELPLRPTAHRCASSVCFIQRMALQGFTWRNGFFAIRQCLVGPFLLSWDLYWGSKPLT